MNTRNLSKWTQIRLLVLVLRLHVKQKISDLKQALQSKFKGGQQ